METIIFSGVELGEADAMFNRTFLTLYEELQTPKADLIWPISSYFGTRRDLAFVWLKLKTPIYSILIWDFKSHHVLTC